MNPQWMKKFMLSQLGLETKMMKMQQKWSQNGVQIQGQDNGQLVNDSEGGGVNSPATNESQSGNDQPVNGDGNTSTGG